MKASFCAKSFSVFFLSTLSAFASPEHDAYTKLFPIHAEYCALSQAKPVEGKAGGPGGHAIVFVQGLCKDPSVNFPRVIPCSQIADPVARGDGGVGISVDSDYQNANWLPYPGYDLFSNGYGYTADMLIDATARDRVVNEVLAKKVFDGVRLKPSSLASQLEYEDSDRYKKEVALATLGTDYAIQFARDMKCIRFPVAEIRLQDAANFLNQTNAPYLGLEGEYKSNPKTYEWNGIENNCAQLSANLLASLGVRKAIPTELPRLKQIFHLGIPRNGLSTLQEQMHHTSVSFRSLEKNALLWDDITDLKWAPVGFGAITKEFPIFKNNELYQTKLWALQLLPTPLNLGVKILIDSSHAFSDPRFSDLKASADYWLGEYQAELSRVANKDETPELKIYREFIQQEITRTQTAQELLK